jgi:hypothetical protein
MAAKNSLYAINPFINSDATDASNRDVHGWHDDCEYKSLLVNGREQGYANA